MKELLILLLKHAGIPLPATATEEEIAAVAQLFVDERRAEELRQWKTVTAWCRKLGMPEAIRRLSLPD